MAEDDAVRVVFDPAQGDDAAPLHFSGPAGRREALHIKVERGFGVLQKNALLAPVLKRPGRTGVPVLPGMVAGVLFAKDDAHQVVRAGCVVAILHLRGDLVVGLGDNLWNRYPGRVITKRAKGFYVGHGLKLSMKLYKKVAGRRASGTSARRKTREKRGRISCAS